MARDQHSLGAILAAAVLILLTSAARCGAQSQLPYPYVPLFQFDVFYNLNLEVDPGAALEFNGPIFCNASMWSGSDVETFALPVEAVGTVSNSVKDPFVNYFGTGLSTFLSGAGPFSGLVPVTFPSGAVSITNAEAILQWPPPADVLGSAAADTPEGETYMANQADLIISNSASGISTVLPSGTNFFVYYQDPTQPLNGNPNNFCPSIIWVTNDFYIVSNVTKHVLLVGSTNYVPAATWAVGGNNFQVWYAGYSFLTNALFYDWREGWNGGNGYGGHGKTVYAVQFDVSKFNTWLSNRVVNGGAYYNTLCQQDKIHSIGGVYIYNSVSLSTTVLPAVRIVNGAELFDSYGLSIATPMPLYVLGDFNTTDGSGSDAAIVGDVVHSRPASFLADAITVLSSGWNDANYSKNPVAVSPDTVNAACLTGIVPSSSSVGTINDTQYSGGVENFLRLLENWGTLYYNGSIVVMFPSQYATNRWLATGNYYNAPVRRWSFDTNFVNLAGLPPLTPLVVNSNAAPAFAGQPENEIVLAGQATNFTVSASGVPAVDYQWTYDGTNIPGASNALLSLMDVQVTDAGDYAVEISNVLGSVISSNALLSVYTSAVPVLGAFSFSQNGGAEFSVSGVPGFNYTVEASTNLVDWIPLMTSNAPFVFFDTNAIFPERFYRGVYSP